MRTLLLLLLFPSLLFAQTIPARVVSVDSEALPAYAGALAVDGDPATFWHTVWTPNIAPLPHEIVLALDQEYELTGLQYLPRQDGNLNGIIGAFEVYVSSGVTVWGAPVASGVWKGQTAARQSVTFPPTRGRFVRLVALSDQHGEQYTNAAEITLQVAPSNGRYQVALAWQDNSANECGFEIEQSPDGQTWSRIAVLNPDIQRWTVGGLLPAEVCFRVRAFNQAGPSAAYTNTQCGVPSSPYIPTVATDKPQSALSPCFTVAIPDDQSRD